MDVTCFKDQFQHLLLHQPRYNLKQVQAENSDYSDTAVKSGSCYYCFGAFYCEDVYYGRYSRKCTDCNGITLCVNCEGCLECVDCANGYFLSYCSDCKDCSECDFCEDCYGCKNCYGCMGLHQKQYYFLNEAKTKEEYEQLLIQMDLRDAGISQWLQDRLEELRKSSPRLGVHHFRAEDCTGDHLSECSNCYQCYDAFALEDCLYTIEANGNTDCCDLTVCFEAELCYSCIQSPINYNCNFLFHTDLSNDSEFCAFSKNLKNCFGCVYLQDAEYHILNEPFSKKEYQELTSQIRKQLIADGDYNLTPYFVSDYEQQRLASESDSSIQPQLP